MSKKIYTKKFQAGENTYFFDIKETDKGNKFLQISENRPLEDGTWLRNEITVFEEHMENFIPLEAEYPVACCGDESR